jgi:hypothetical protein
MIVSQSSDWYHRQKNQFCSREMQTVYRMKIVRDFQRFPGNVSWCFTSYRNNKFMRTMLTLTKEEAVIKAAKTY